MDSGKSTLVAVLTHGQKGRPLLDNGHGSARMNVLRCCLAFPSELNHLRLAPQFLLRIQLSANMPLASRHKHEIESGRTSSLSHHTLAYDADAGVLNYAGVAPMMPSEIAAAASKATSCLDPVCTGPWHSSHAPRQRRPQ